MMVEMLLGIVLIMIGALTLSGCMNRSSSGESGYEEDKNGGESDTAEQPEEQNKEAKELELEEQNQKLVDLEDYTDAPQDNGCPYYVKVNRQKNVVTVYALDEDGYYTVPVRAMVCSVGKEDGTPTGTYTTKDKHTWCSLVGGVYGQYAYRIDGQIMFHSVPYYSMNKDDLETAEYNKLGEAASLGCVRLAVADAKWIYDNCPTGTIVTIYDSDYNGPLGKPTSERLTVGEKKSVWDPTDPDPENPWMDGSVRILRAGDRTIERGCTWQKECGVLVYDAEGQDITDRLRVLGDVDADTVGEYEVTYQIVGENGVLCEKTSTIRVADTMPPEIAFREKRITMNRAEASDANIVRTLCQYIQVTDNGSDLSEDHLEFDLQALDGASEGEYTITVSAQDDAGNRTQDYSLMVSLDRVSPQIQEPEQKSYTGTGKEDIEAQLIAAIPVTDSYSGVGTVQVSWTPEPGKESYTVLVTAKDRYGNVSTAFFDDFIISYTAGE